MPFLNQRLFADHYLSERVPALDQWGEAGAAAEAAHDILRARFAAVAELVTGHEGQTEEHWIRPVFELLGFSFQVFPSITTAGGTRWPDYALFASEEIRLASQPHHGTVDYFSQCLAVADAKVWNRSLDQRSLAGDPFDRRNPNVQIDYYLRETDTRWAILTNGRKWRLYSRDTSYRLDSYYEVDLIDLLRGGVEEFKYFWIFFRAAAFDGQPGSFLDEVASGSSRFATGLTERVKERVYGAVREFVNGFLSYTPNQLDPYRDIDAAFHASLILLYRLLFVLYGESRGLLPLSNGTYRSIYSLAAIKEELAGRLDVRMALLPTSNTYSTKLRNLFRLVERGSTQLGIPEYNGGLFDDGRYPFLAIHEIGDPHLAQGIDLLARVRDANGDQVFIDYRTLDVRHLGDIYEGLLEYHARFAEADMVAVPRDRSEVWVPAATAPPNAAVRERAAEGTIFLSTGKGERRSTGSYYTPQSIVSYMVEESVGRRVAELTEQHEGSDLVEAILDLRVCDPAMGSGHFLVETVDYLARVLVRLSPDPEAGQDDTELQRWRRRVVESCVYGVDQNPLAVELAKLSLWLATVSIERPLSFLDSHLVQGNSLIGTTIDQLRALPRAQNDQDDLFTEHLTNVLPAALSELQALGARVSDTVDDVHEKEQLLEQARRLMRPFKIAAHVWVGSEFGIDVSTESYERLLDLLGRPKLLAKLIAEEFDLVLHLADDQYQFFHWQLEFPEVFLADPDQSGFDVVITNPPYVNASELNDVLTEYEKPYWRTGFHSARGAYDLYVLFMELCLTLAREGGYASLITPNKYLAAPYASALRAYLLDQHQLLQLLDGSRVSVFDDPMIYPVVSLFRAYAPQGEEFVDVRKLVDRTEWLAHAKHPSRYLSLLPETIWAFLLLDDAELLIRIAERSNATSENEHLRVVASTTAAEADAFGGHLREFHLASGEGWRVLNTGIVESWASEWGLERLHHQRRAFLRPVLPHATSVVSDTRREQYSNPKLIFAKLCRRLTAVVDAEGDYAGLNLNFIQSDASAIDLYGALYNSTLMNWVYEGYFGALRMAGGFMQVQAPQLRVLPLPPALCGSGAAQLPDVTQELAEAGRERRVIEQARMERRISLVDELLAALSLEDRKLSDPAWVLPRQSRMIEALEDPDHEDLDEFWRALRMTVRQLRVQLGAQREALVVQTAQRARKDFLGLARDAATLDRRVDALVYALFELKPEDIQRIEEGPPEIAGLSESTGD